MAATKLASAILLFGSWILIGLPACSNNPYVQGKLIYEYKCGNCHMPSGEGLVGNIPPLADADWLIAHRDEIVCTIRYGMKGPMLVNGLEYNGVMQGFPELSDTEVTNVANYLLTAWGNDQPPIMATRVPEMLSNCDRNKPIIIGNPQQLPVFRDSI